jgi:hypothetical protein
LEGASDERGEKITLSIAKKSQLRVTKLELKS